HAQLPPSGARGSGSRDRTLRERAAHHHAAQGPRRAASPDPHRDGRGAAAHRSERQRRLTARAAEPAAAGHDGGPVPKDDGRRPSVVHAPALDFSRSAALLAPHAHHDGTASPTGARRMRVLAGTSGYAYKEWKGSFYPEDLPADAMLGYYASQ